MFTFASDLVHFLITVRSPYGRGWSPSGLMGVLLRALDVEPVKTGIDQSTILLYNRLCVVDSPTRNLFMFMLRDYVSHNKLIQYQAQYYKEMFGIHSQGTSHILPEDVLADTLNNLLLQDN